MCQQLYNVYPFCYHLLGSSRPELRECGSVPPGRETCAEVTKKPMPKPSHYCQSCAPARERFYLALAHHRRLYVDDKGRNISGGHTSNRLAAYRRRHNVAASRVAQRLQMAYLQAFWGGPRRPGQQDEPQQLLLALTRSMETINACVEAKWSQPGGPVLRFEWGRLAAGAEAVGRGTLDRYAGGDALCDVLYFSFFDLAGWCHPIRGTGYDEIAAVCAILLRNGIQDFEVQRLGGGPSIYLTLPTLRAQRPSPSSLEQQPRKRTYPSDDPKLAHFYKTSES
ncbi:hypothetical protein F5X96DRAFT_684483 [Biscogniauxia mediterranea]|nr:hypothetical protein F5X96DRAFT_684483 [Biscogniauxia mediterranea]